MEIDMLKNIIADKGMTESQLAKSAKIFKLKLYLGFGGMVEFTFSEIVRIARALELSEEEVAQIFFDTKVS